MKMREYGTWGPGHPDAPASSPLDAERRTASATYRSRSSRSVLVAIGALCVTAAVVLVALAGDEHAGLSAPASGASATLAEWNAAAESASVSAAAASGLSKHNVLLLMVDQARVDAFSELGSDGSSGPYTPHFADLFSQGAKFTKAYTSTPMCTPARQSLMTGLKPWSHGSRTYTDYLVPEKYSTWTEMPQAMHDAGYHTACIGKNHFMYNATTLTWFNHGFEESKLYEGDLAFNPTSSDFVMLDNYGEFFNASCPNCDQLATPPRDEENAWYGATYVYNESVHPTAWTGGEAVKWLDEWTTSEKALAGTPFFLKVSFVRPHSPYDPPTRWYEDVLRRVGPELAGISKAATTNGSKGWDTVFRKDVSLCNTSIADTHCGFPGEGRIKQSRALYYASLSFVDEWVGKVMDQVVSAGLMEKSLVLFVADHGDALGDHNLWRKGYSTQQVASIPFFVRWPSWMDSDISVDRGSEVSSVVELRDVFPTVADFAGVNLDGVDGASVLSLLEDPSASWRSYVDLEFSMCSMSEWMNWAALTDGTHKYVYWLYNGTEQFFNIEDDPYETVDLAARGDDPTAVEFWRKRLVVLWKEEGRGLKWVKEDSLQTFSRCSMVELTENYPCYDKALPGNKQSECSNY